MQLNSHSPQTGKDKMTSQPKSQKGLTESNVADSHETVAHEIEQFMKDPKFRAALEEDVEIFGQEGVAQIRAAIIDALSARISDATEKDLLKKTTGAIHALGQSEIRIAANKTPTKTTASKGAPDVVKIKKSATRRAVLAHLTGMAADPRFTDSHFDAAFSADPRFNGRNGDQNGKTGKEKQPNGPVMGDLTPELQKIKSESKRRLEWVNKIKDIKTRKERTENEAEFLAEVYAQNHFARQNIGFIGQIANLYFNSGNYAKAFFYAEKILELDRGDIIALRIAKLSAQKLEKWAEALKYAEGYLNFWPDHLAALGIASLAAIKIGNYEKALEYAGQKIELEKNDRKLMPALGIAARAAYELNRNEEALKYCKRYLAFSPRNEEKLSIAAFSAFHLKKYEEAIRYARRYFNDPSLGFDPDIVRVLAECAYELGLVRKMRK